MYDNFPAGMKAYLSQYGWHFSKAMCDWAVSMMEKEDGNGKKVKIQPIVKDQLDTILKQYGIELKKKEGCDYIYVANMCKADYLGSSISNDQYLAKFIKDYIDDPDVIGWTYETGLAVILTNSKGGTKRMFIGKKYKHMTDGNHIIDIIDGYGEFICDEASLNLYIAQK